MFIANNSLNDYNEALVNTNQEKYSNIQDLACCFLSEKVSANKKLSQMDRGRLKTIERKKVQEHQFSSLIEIIRGLKLHAI